MRLNYQFTNICGCAYREGNILFTADGSSMVSPVANRIAVFDLVNHSSQTLRFQMQHNITCIALSPDNKLLVTVDTLGFGAILNFQKQIVLATMNFSHKGSSVTVLKFSPDSKYLCVAHGNWISVWKSPSLIIEWRAMYLYGKYRGHQGDITCISWSPDSQFFVSGSKDKTVKIHALHKQKPFRSQRLPSHRGQVIDAFFGSDYKLYVVTRTGYVYQYIAGAQRAVHAEYKETRPLLMYAQYTPNGYYKLGIRHGTGWKKDYIINCASFFLGKSCDLLVVGMSSGRFHLYKMPNFELIHSLTISNSNITSCVINNIGDWIGFSSGELGQLFVWEWRSETYILKQQGHFYDVNCMAFSLDGNLIATGGHDGKLKIWNASNGFCFITFHDHTAPITQITFAKKNNVLIMTASLDGTVRVYDLLRYINFRTLTPPNDADYKRFLSDLVSDMTTAADADGGGDPSDGAKRRKKMLENKLHSGAPQQTARFICLAVDDSGEVIMAGCEEPFEIYVWSLRTGKCLDVLYGHEGPVSCLTFSSKTNILVSGSWDKTLRFWDLYSSASREIIECNSEILDVDYRFDGKEICLCTLGGQLQIYEVVTGKHLNSIDIGMDVMGGRNGSRKRAKTNHFTTINYSPNGKLLIAGGVSKYVCLYYLPQSLLVKRYVTSNNVDLEGVEESTIESYRNARKRRKVDENRDERERNRDIISKERNQLPGVAITDFSSRRKSRVIATKCVSFSPTGEMWAAATTDGLLLYSQNDLSIFDPIDLDISITPQTIKKEVMNKSYAKALIMSIKLNDKLLIKQVIESVPNQQISICIQALKSKYFETMLYVLSEDIQNTQYLQFYLLWINKLCTIHSRYLKSNFVNFLPYLRLIHKSLSTLYKDISPNCDSNIHRLAFLSSFGRKQKRKRIEFKHESKQKSVVIKPSGEFKPIPFQPLPDDDVDDKIPFRMQKLK